MKNIFIGLLAMISFSGFAGENDQVVLQHPTCEIAYGSTYVASIGGDRIDRNVVFQKLEENGFSFSSPITLPVLRGELENKIYLTAELFGSIDMFDIYPHFTVSINVRDAEHTSRWLSHVFINRSFKVSPIKSESHQLAKAQAFLLKQLPHCEIVK